MAKRLEQGWADTTIKSFQVLNSFVKDLMATKIPEQLSAIYPNLPIEVDVTKAASQLGLRPAQFEALMQAIIQGSGRAGQ